ncbi:MAG: transposase [Methylotetracoccus sp.]
MARAAPSAGGGHRPTGESQRLERPVRLKERGLAGVEFVVSDDHAGSARHRRSTGGSGWQRCYVHLLRATRWITYPARPTTIAYRNCAGCMTAATTRSLCAGRSPDRQVGSRYPKLVDWVETYIGETLTFYRLPRQHHKHMKSTNMLERLNEEIKRRTRVVRIFPNTESCLRLVRALCVETHEAWLEDNRYLNMSSARRAEKGTPSDCA